MVDGSTSVATTACDGNSMGSKVAGGGAGGAGDGGFMEIGVASMAKTRRGGEGVRSHTGPCEKEVFLLFYTVRWAQYLWGFLL